jgi:hypothetical protein
MDCAFHLERPLPFERLGPGCQFQKSQFPKFAPDLIEFDGKTWCPFHLPMESADGSPSPKAGWDGQTIREFNEAIFAFIDKAKAEGRPAGLAGTVFPGDITFDRYRDGTSELPSVSFFRAHFSGNAGFQEAHFGGDADFEKARFGDTAWFDKAQFSGSAWFEEPQFDRGARFKEARFGGNVWFRGARFGGNADFSGAPGASEGGNDGKDGSISDRFHFVTFAGARFSDHGYTRFSNRRFLDQTDFSKAIFPVAPEFHNAVLHQDTDFTGTRFLDTETDHAARAYRTLKLAMERVRARDGEAVFHALEMESRRKREETPLSVKVFSLLYKWAADYGRSFISPLGWLGETAGIFFLVYLICFAALTTGGLVEQDVWDVWRFTMRQIVRPFDAFTLGTTEGLPASLSRIPLWLGFVAAIQSILSLGLIALFILALRRRFRMG